MLWNKDEASQNVEDRRDEGGGGGGGGMRIGLGGALVLLVLSIVFKKNFFALLDSSSVPSGSAATSEPRPHDPKDDQMVKFISFVLDDVQATWARLLPPLGTKYQEARLVVFTGATASGCGTAEARMGPFYCPEDRKVYIDLGFFNDLKTRFGAPGDFAQAYVIAHEMGHHVQRLLGIEEKVRSRQEAHPDMQNELSVRLELQADCLAGVWGHSTEERHILEAGDVDEGLAAAAAVGDDRLQKASRGRVNPETFTHGSSRQRVDWFRRGFTSGSVNACDTFGAGSL